ncbi:MAG TPA: GNAT family N-acetyltransferase [Ktedonobacteraceae bacterium]|nr:GNAT family N-acetyltransferase [Ktedonobacteraceae bacterium]
MMTGDSQIVLIDALQTAAAGALLADAFFSDTLNSYVFPDPEERRRVLPWYFTASVLEGTLLNSAYATVGQMRGVAVWTPPGLHERTPERARQSGLDQMAVRFGPEAYRRFMEIIDHLEHVSSQVVPSDHWYLSLIGVSPLSQGQGIGGALLTPVLQRADVEGISCYLETFEAKNLAFYQRHGFQVVATDTEPHSQLPFWAMRRDPV